MKQLNRKLPLLRRLPLSIQQRLFCLILFLASPVWAQEGHQLLREMAESFRTLDYDATIVLQRNGEMSTAQLTPLLPDD